MADDAAPSEGAIYQMKARHAKMAMGEALADAKSHLLKAADARPLVAKHPYAAVGGAAALGLVAALVVVPSSKQRAARRLAALERAVRLESAAGGRKVGGGAKPTLGRRAFGLAFRFAKPTLLSLITGSLSGAAGGAAAGAQTGQDAARPEPAADVT